MTLVGVLASCVLVVVMKPMYNGGEFTFILELVMVAMVFGDPVCLVKFLIIDACGRFRCDDPPSVTTKYACDGNRCDVAGNDVIGLDVIVDDVTSDVISSGVTNDDITADVLDWNALGGDVSGDIIGICEDEVNIGVAVIEGDEIIFLDMEVLRLTLFLASVL